MRATNGRWAGKDRGKRGKRYFKRRREEAKMTNMPDKRKKREKREGKKKDAARIPNLPFFVNFSPLLPNIHFQEKTLFGMAQQQCCISLLLPWLFCLGNYYCTAAAEGFFAYLCRMRNREGGCKKFPKKASSKDSDNSSPPRNHSFLFSCCRKKRIFYSTLFLHGKRETVCSYLFAVAISLPPSCGGNKNWSA